MIEYEKIFGSFQTARTEQLTDQWLKLPRLDVLDECTQAMIGNLVTPRGKARRFLGKQQSLAERLMEDRKHVEAVLMVNSTIAEIPWRFCGEQATTAYHYSLWMRGQIYHDLATFGDLSETPRTSPLKQASLYQAVADYCQADLLLGYADACEAEDILNCFEVLGRFDRMQKVKEKFPVIEEESEDDEDDLYFRTPPQTPTTLQVMDSRALNYADLVALKDNRTFAGYDPYLNICPH